LRRENVPPGGTELLPVQFAPFKLQIVIKIVIELAHSAIDLGDCICKVS
jgi:hypothetical protein